MTRSQLEHQANEAGISCNYTNTHGQQQAITDETLQRLVKYLRQTSSHLSSPIPSVRVFIEGSNYQIPISITDKYYWQFITESGNTLEGVLDNHLELLLPADLPQGYHQLMLSTATTEWSCQIIICPQRCYQPKTLQEGKKLWGACVQLYTLRSEKNWGIGDFGDLKQMLVEMAKRGGAFVGLNPLHALYPANPNNASPYNPSSRHWLNIIYLDINQIEEFHLSQTAQQWWQQPKTQQRLHHARTTEWVDYQSVTALKLEALHHAFPIFQQRSIHDSRRQRFQQFVDDGGQDLHQQALYDALHAYLQSENTTLWGWPVWPSAYQNPNNQAVIRFCEQHQDLVQFYLWLQWLAQEQLADCYKQSQETLMPIGLYRDLAVGVAKGGAETWGDRELYCLHASIGAPPDMLGPLGQNWELPPIYPHILQQRAYQPFIDLLRANMTSCGALRLDHVMSLLRLWWIPEGETANNGAYVHYPIDDLLGILALESQRHHCMVIGEDLGIVPVDLITKLRDKGVYSYKVLYFEQNNYDYFSPQQYSAQSIATLTTHDLPTLRGYWEKEDLILGQQLDFYPDSETLHKLHQDRDSCKQGIVNALYQSGNLSEYIEISHHPHMSQTLNQSIHGYIADCGCDLVGLQPEDWLNMAMPVNLPGTKDQYPNWRRKLNRTLKEMFSDPQINELLADIHSRRTATSKD